MLAWLLQQTNIHFIISNISNLHTLVEWENVHLGVVLKTCVFWHILYICIYTVYVRVLTFCISAYIQCMSECWHFVYLHIYSVCQSANILYICIYTVYVRVLTFCISAYIQCMSECWHFVYLHIYSVCQSADILYICIYTVYVRVLTFCISAYIQCMSECCLTHDYCTMLTCTVLRKYSHWIQAWSIAILRNAVVLLSSSRHMGKGNTVWA